MKQWIVFAAAAGVLVLAGDWSTPVRAQQHSYTQAQIDEGRGLYEANCGRCHAETGTGVPGVELFRQIRRATSDDEIAALIQQGIPGTSMPPHRIANAQAASVVAFLRTMVNAAPVSTTALTRSFVSTVDIARGNAVRGKSIFSGKAACAGCHRAAGAGGTSGPDLSAIGAPRLGFFFGGLPVDVPSLERALVEPDADIAAAYRKYQATPNQGSAVLGQLLNQDTFTIQMLDDAGNLRSLAKTDLREFGFMPSPMPSFRERLTTQELADVLAYLLTLRGER